MAKKKVKRIKRRSHRIGRIKSNSAVMDLLLVAGGGLASKVLSNQLAKSSSSFAQKAAPFSGAVAGILAAMFVKNENIKKIGLGALADGVPTALGSTGLKIISGFENTIAGVGYPGRAQIVNYGNQRMIAGSAGAQGLAKGTRSNFSGSRLSQMNTIAGILGCCS